jgi:hypothetical protein
MNLNTRHFAVLGASAVAVANIVQSGSHEITLAAVGVLSAAFVWDKIEKNLHKDK